MFEKLSFRKLGLSSFVIGIVHERRELRFESSSCVFVEISMLQSEGGKWKFLCVCVCLLRNANNSSGSNELHSMQNLIDRKVSLQVTFSSQKVRVLD